MTNASGIAAGRLKSFIERIERLEEEKAAIADDIKEVYAEAKSSGFETKIMRMIVRLRKMDAQERSEQEQLLEVYAQAVGLAHTPLGDAAAEREQADRAPSAAKAVAKFVEGIPDGGSVTVTTGGKSTTITKDAAGKASVAQAARAPSPHSDSAAQGETTARTATRTVSEIAPKPTGVPFVDSFTAALNVPVAPEPLAPPRDSTVTASLSALKQQMAAS